MSNRTSKTWTALRKRTGVRLALTLIAANLLMAWGLPLRLGIPRTALCMAAVNVSALLWYLHRITVTLDRPLTQLYQSLGHCLDGQTHVIDWDHTQQGPVSEVAERMQTLVNQIRAHEQMACSDAARQANTQARRSMAHEICRTALPQVLPDLPSRSYFAVDGLVEDGAGTTRQFYDYFFIDPGLLCVVIGHTPGEGVAESVYLVTAQTMIRSRLRLGRSLEQTMSDVNAQLYDLGSSFGLYALVGTLSTVDGRFTYVNAGQQPFMRMRNADRYERVQSPAYAPLGLQEHVSYRAMEFRLRQGDRLFFYTQGLTALLGPDGTEYGTQQLRADLNTSRSKNLDDRQLLRFMRERAAQYCGELENSAFAMLTLLYCKGDKELAHCDVPAKAEYAQEVLEFLKKQFAENGIQKRHYARQAVIMDEVFALCCRKATPDSRIMVECGIAPDAQMVNIRVTAVLGGVDPMQNAQMEVERNAVQFIQEHADYVTFKPGTEWDTLTVVCFLD